MKKNIISQILIGILLVALLTTVVFAYYFEKDSGWEQQISATSINFKVNGKNINTITNNAPVSLYKGGEAELKFDVSVTSTTNVKAMAKYALKFTLASDATNNELARAVEVYEYKNGKYDYVSMLDSFSRIDGLIPVNSTVSHIYKLVYSTSAGEYYEGKTFNLAMAGESEIVFNEDNRHFVSSYLQFLDTINNANLYSGKTITLNRDITLPLDTVTPANNALVLGVPASLDFNGHTLTIDGGVSLSFTHGATSAQKQGIYNSSSIGGLSGAGKFYINTANDCMYIQDTLNAQTLSKIEVIGYSFNEAVALMSAKAKEVEKKVVISGEAVDFGANLHHYFAMANGLTYALSAEDGAILNYSAEKGFFVSASYNFPITVVKPIKIKIAKGAETSFIDIGLKLRGNSAGAIADYLLATVPNSVHSSLFLPSYDTATKATITWVTTDSKLLSDTGAYLPEGHINLASWSDQKMQVGVIVDVQGERISAQKEVTLVMLSARERTEIIYNYNQIILETEKATIDFYAKFVDSIGAKPAGLKDIIIKIAADGSNDLKTGKKCLEIVKDANGYDDIKLANAPTADNLKKVNISVTFKYANLGGDITYTVDKVATVVGKTPTTDLSDITPILQKLFESNDYINFPDKYEFTVSAYTPQGVNVDYFVEPAYNNTILIENDVFQAQATGNGHFALLADGKYHFIKARYNKVGADYVIAPDGAYVIIDDVEYTYATLLASGKIFERVTRIKVLPALVPSKNVLAKFTAKIWSIKDGNGNKVYHQSNGVDLEYYLTLALRGIYHNTPTEIADFNFYKKLIEYFDLNGNGWIEVSEAKSDWRAIQQGVASGAYKTKAFTELASYDSGGAPILYASFRDSNLESLKGLEYFTGAIGLDFTTNNLIDLSALSKIYNLAYLNLNGNKVTDLSALQYLDNLQYLNLGANTITDITALQYLPNLRDLNVSNNSDIIDFSILVNYKKLQMLNVQQVDNTHTDNTNIMYILSLVCDNNPNIEIHRLYDIDPNHPIAPWKATPLQIVAARALSELLLIDEVYTTLNIPNTYYYEYVIGNVTYKDTYNLRWQTVNADDKRYLTFLEDGNFHTIGYQINTPIVKKEIQISIEVAKVYSSGGTSESIQLARPFYIDLLAGQTASSATYIEIASGNFVDAALAVPDDKLRNLLFDTFNTNTDGTVSGASYPNKNVLTQAELNQRAYTIYNFNKKGIKNLQGLRYFVGAFALSTLNLQGNVLDNADISELSHLNGMTGLILNGQKYDYTQLIPTTGDRLTSLKELDVSGAYDLDGELTLQQLYKIYLSNTVVSIKVAGGVTWNPYEKLLKKYAQTLPMALSFTNLADVGQYYTTANQFFTFNFYGVKDIEFRLTDLGLYGVNSTAFNFVKVGGKVTGISYNKLLAYTDAVYAAVMLSGNDGTRSDFGTTVYTELKANFNKNIIVKDGGNEFTLDMLFPGRSLRSAVLDKLNDVFLKPSASSIATIGSGYYKKDGDPRYYITYGTIMQLAFSATDYDVLIDGIYDNGVSSIEGLQYTLINNLHIVNDAYIGDGRYLANLTSLKITGSGVDFSDISVDLPFLKSLIVGTTNTGEGNRYFHMSNGANYYLSHFTGLTELNILNSNVYNWDGLKAIGDKASNSVANFKIYAINDANFTNHNNATAETEAIVRNIYNKSTATTKNYYIGTATDPTDSKTPYVGTWIASSGATSLVTTVLKEYKEFSPEIIDLDFRIGSDSALANSAYFGAHTTQTIANAGNTIWLPKSTGGFSYGTASATNERTRNFAIEWETLGITAGTAASLFGGADSILSSGTEGIYNLFSNKFKAPTSDYLTLTVTRQASSDYYVMFRGTIGGGYYKNDGAFEAFSGAKKRFLYPVLIKNSANPSVPTALTGKTSFAVFTDTGMRSAAFMTLALFGGGISDGAIVTATASDIQKISISSTAIDVQKATAPANITTLKYVNGGDFATPDNLKQRCAYIYNIDGIGVFNNVKHLAVTDTYLSNVDGIDGLKDKVEKVYFSGNLLTNVQGFKNCAQLAVVDIQKNDVETIVATGTNHSVFEASMAKLTAIELRYNQSIRVVDINALAANGTAPGTIDNKIKLTKVTLQNTQCEGHFELVQALTKLIRRKMISDADTDVENTKIAISLANETAYNITYYAADNFIKDCNSGAIANYRNPAIGIGYDNALTQAIVYGDRSYTATYMNPNIYGSTKLGEKSIVTPILVSNDNGLYAYLECIYSNPNASSKELYAYPGSTVKTIASDFDPAMWAYLTGVAEANIDGGKRLNFAPNASAVNIEIKTNIGLKSLKGLEKLNNIKQINIITNPLQELGFTANFSSLQSLSIRDTKMPIAGFSALPMCTGLSNLDLSSTYGLDYTAIVSGGKTLAEIIAAMPSLGTIRTNSYKNYNMYMPSEGNSIFAAVKGTYDNADKFMGVVSNKNKAVFTCGIYQYNTRKELQDVDATIANMAAFTNYSSVSKLAYVSNVSNGNMIYVTRDFRKNYEYMIKSVFNTFNYHTADASRYIPDRIYENDIRKTGIGIDLPTSFNMYNAAQNITVRAYSNVHGEITNQVIKATTVNGKTVRSFYIDNAIYTALNVTGEITITLSFTSPLFSQNYPIKVIPADKLEEPNKRLAPYYFQMSNNANDLQPASKYIKSGLLLHWLFNDYKLLIKDAILPKNGGGWYMTNAAINAVSTLRLVDLGITTIDGIQIFKNLTVLAMDDDVVVTDIAVLKTLKLTSFTYTNSKEQKDPLSPSPINNFVVDFTPLLGSKDTLTYFEYSSQSNTNIIDLSFLLAMSDKIATVKICPTTKKTGTSQSSLLNKYLTTTGFKFILAWYELYRPKCYFYLVNNDINDAVFVANFEWYWRNVGNTPTLFPKVTAEFKKAAQLFLQMDTVGSDVTYANNYQLYISNFVKAGNNITINLPAFINASGVTYAIDWRSMSSFVSCKGAKFVTVGGASYTFPLKGGNVTYKNGDIIPYSNLTELLNSYVYKNLEFAKIVSIAYVVEIQDIHLSKSVNFAIIARVKQDGFDYDRIYTIDATAPKTPAPSPSAPKNAVAIAIKNTKEEELQ